MAPLHHGTITFSTTCMNNGGVGGAPMVYSTAFQGGTAVNCALIFQFQ